VVGSADKVPDGARVARDHPGEDGTWASGPAPTAAGSWWHERRGV